MNRTHNERRGRAAVLAMMLILTAGGTTVFAQETRLQRGFSSVELGMSLDAASTALESDPNFRYRGPADVQFLPITQLPLIETEGRAFVSRGIFQFKDDSLYVIALLLDQTRLDYFSVYTSLVAKYGEPTMLDPGQARWEDGATRIALERPLTVKYIDLDTFNAIVAAGQKQEALDEITRDRFLSGL